MKAVWERAASEDPYFAVLSDPAKRGGRWDRAAFFQSGSHEVATVLTHLEGLGLTVARDAPALDFGSGLGRLTVPLAEHFARAVGVDVSASMVSRASELHAGSDRVSFVLNERDDLSSFSDGEFGFVYSNIVLQHLPPGLARRYVQEFVRVVRPDGIVVFQLPDSFREGWVGWLRTVLRLRTRLRAVVGRPSPEPADHVEWEMHGTPEAEVRRWVSVAGAEVVDVALTNATEPTFNGNLSYLANPPRRGWVSKQYSIVV